MEEDHFHNTEVMRTRVFTEVDPFIITVKTQYSCLMSCVYFTISPMLCCKNE